MAPLVDPDFWRGRSVLVTGHTGFKGAWLVLWLESMGARVTGFADVVPTRPSLYELAQVGDGLVDVRGDVRDYAAVLDVVALHAPRSSSAAVRRRRRQGRAQPALELKGLRGARRGAHLPSPGGERQEASARARRQTSAAVATGTRSA